ncbi:rho GTP binding protein RhoU [Trichuris trichiura]|uniref:Rho GTP binding protein RhoU n=1 Tax=Trichuris trichiura TaxID=36087 RepID=A0A077Z8L9_TRITR|nr:rho GTP binding protein RhoU [Trichuris trichiura]
MVEKLGSYCASPTLSSEDGGGGAGRPIKCVLVGDGAVGKTSLIVSYTTNGYPQEYVPTAFDNYSVLVTVNDRPIRLQLCDTAGQEDFDTLRHLCYPNSHVLLLCFSVVCPASFSNVQQRWLPEVRRYCPRAPVVLVGTQCDLRTNIQVLVDLNRFHEAPVSPSEAQHVAKKINAVQYIECSALTQVNLKEVFDVAILAALNLTAPIKPKIFVHHVKARLSMRRLKQKLTRPSSVEALQHPGLCVKRHLSSTSAIPTLVESISSRQQVNCKLPSFRKGSRTSNANGPTKSKWSPKMPADTEAKERTGWRRFLCFS